MRLICTITDKERGNPYEFSYFLASQGIENECEEYQENGAFVYRIWIYEEDLVERASEHYREYQSNPTDSRYQTRTQFANHVQKKKLEPSSTTNDNKAHQNITPRRRFLSPSPYGPISILILLIVISLFITAQIQRGNVSVPKITGILPAPLLSSVEKSLIYDYPYYFILRDQLFKIYTPEEIEQKKPPSSEAVELIKKIKKTPLWMGIYERIVNHFHNSKIPLGYQGPMFEKIKQGEVWRCFTPIFLHLDLLHIFFNVLWFILLGNQIEFRIGWWRYCLLIFISALISNTAQYLISGPFFMGLSGVVVAMAAFIWARQQRAAWEGYLLHNFTLIFLAIFVIGMFLLQIVLFFLQMFGTYNLAIGIANTAHLTGALVGYLLGRLSFFAIHPRIKK